MENKKTLVIGASPKPHRYAYTCVKELQKYGHPVVALGLRKDKIGQINIETDFPEVGNVDTVTMYVGPQNQPLYYDYILEKIKPKRIIFNPGTENEEFAVIAEAHNIEVVINCTLMMLSYDTY